MSRPKAVPVCRRGLKIDGKSAWTGGKNEETPGGREEKDADDYPPNYPLHKESLFFNCFVIRFTWVGCESIDQSFPYLLK